jgi:hypothetical protein
VTPGPWVLLDPTVSGESVQRLSPRLDSLAHKRIGVLWNGKTHGDAVLMQLVDELCQQDLATRALFATKPLLGNVAPAEVLDELAGSCDAVIVGVGACGSCTAGSVLDAISLEELGVPAAMVGTEILTSSVGRGMASIHGYPEFPMATLRDVGYMGAAIGADEAGCIAAELLPQVRSILLRGHNLPDE